MSIKILNKSVAKGPQARDVDYGSCCTFPRYGNNKVCMRVKSRQPNVDIIPKDPALIQKMRMLDISDGTFYLVDPWEPCVMVALEASVVAM